MRLVSLALSIYILIVAYYILGKRFDYPFLKKFQPAIAPMVEPVLSMVHKLLDQFVPEKYRQMDWPPFALLIILLLISIIL